MAKEKSEKDKVKNLMGQRREFESRLKSLDFEIQKEHERLAPVEAGALMGAVREFAGLFSGGAVKEAFDKVLYHLTTLNLYDRDYLKHLIEGDHLGLNYDTGAKYICETLLNGHLTPRADLWAVLKRIYDTRQQAGNPFIKGGE